MEKQKSTELTPQSISEKLKSDITIRAPGWVYLAAIIGALVLLAIALD